MTKSNKSPEKSSDRNKKILEKLRKDIIGTLLIGIVLFLAAGKLKWTAGWIYIGVNFLGIILNAVILTIKNPELMAKRATLTQEDTKSWDKIFHALYGPLLLLIMAIIGLDAGRFVWSSVPRWLQTLSIVLFILGWGFSLWAMAVNKHFETSVRIQEDREHKTITSGPYAIVRHPGYSGIMLLYIVSPTFLGSWWGLIPAMLLMIAFILRTVKEDQTLQEELPGYQKYAQKVRYRLFPGLW